ncbi:hypothetical protein PT974_02181 [Cladobotryum mycophilum]|uniref:CFEM domain-containing protein n=1 Tax=Cladobotryum mycophilum TaxID=491253 RepID=A0ABR0SXB9_9HYPO
MKVSPLILVATLFGSAIAQNRADFLPSCSLKCLDNATQKTTNCALDDAVCWCVQKNYEAIYNSALACVLQACGPDVSVGKVLPAAAKFCAAASASASAHASPTQTSNPSSSEDTTTVKQSSSPSVTAGPGSPSNTTGTSAPTSTSASTGAAATAGPLGTVAFLVAGAIAAL